LSAFVPKPGTTFPLLVGVASISAMLLTAVPLIDVNFPPM